MDRDFKPGREFDGLVAVITGGAGGIGVATANYLLARGAIIASIDTSASLNTKCLSKLCDITRDPEVIKAVNEIASELGGIDVLINNAGIGAGGNVTENSDSKWMHLLDVNLLGAVRVSRAAIPFLRNSASPSIVNTCSVVANIGLPNRALYSASKGALEALTRSMAADLLSDGIRVNAVSPGTADTPWVDRIVAASEDPISMRAGLVARQPMKRLVSAQEVAHAIAYLASPLSGSTTGTVLPVDAGLHSLRIN